MKVVLLTTLAGLLTACASNDSSPMVEYKETLECANYKGMRTAPIEPRALAHLKKLCEESELKQKKQQNQK